MPTEIRKIAQRILFGTTLEEKLGFPHEEVVDTTPGSAIVTPRHVSRPDHLKLREDGVRADHPSRAKLIDEKERGRLLHFFANHELLATELMALTLLKFPDAPASFRRGLLATLREEQIHTKLYIHRMKQCGVDFGELPLSDYFWKNVSSMEDPLDYVTRLSLTFEQANLDYARDYSQLFAAMGDRSTATLLNRIYHDEIDHVAFGLKWFRRWKAAGQSDWQAYGNQLVFPLSPARAKGHAFNRDGRRAAGFDQTFIDDLEVFQQSRGRTPSVRWFNPDAERFASHNTTPRLPLQPSVLQADLAFLPAFLSRQDDMLIMTERPSHTFLRQIQTYGFRLPEILTCETSAKGIEAPPISRKVGNICPWAWTPDSIAFLCKTFASSTRTIDPDTLWNDERRRLYDKTWAAAWAKAWVADSPGEDWLAPAEVYGQSARNLSELTALCDQWAGTGYRTIVCKAPFGTSAHGNRLMLPDEAIPPALQTWLTETWQQQGEVLVEPWLERIYDFSVQYERGNGNLKPLAYMTLINNTRGQFRGILTNGFCKGIDPAVKRFLMTPINNRPRVYQWYEECLTANLASQLEAARFSGPLGVDAFVYRDPDGRIRLKPVCEINPRTTMGSLAHKLQSHNAPGSVGYFQILNKSQIKKRTTLSIPDFAKELTERHSVTLTTADRPQIITGSFPLNDPLVAQTFLAVYHVRRSIQELPI